jgi:hypothetical protein
LSNRQARFGIIRAERTLFQSLYRQYSSPSAYSTQTLTRRRG